MVGLQLMTILIVISLMNIDYLDELHKKLPIFKFNNKNNKDEHFIQTYIYPTF